MCRALLKSLWPLGQGFPNESRGRVRLSPAKINAWLASPDAVIAFARDGERLVGYAIAVRTRAERYGVITWITQLVVHEEYRRLGVAKTLLFSLWGFSDDYAWGIVSPNPYAIRALEKATRRRCVPDRIARNKRKLLDVAAVHVPYISRETESSIQAGGCRINTKFFVDLSGLDEMLANATASGVDWLLGCLESGWEWFAFQVRGSAATPSDKGGD